MTCRVLITGVTGFVGRHILNSLAKSGVSVRAVVREGKQNQVSKHAAVAEVITTPDLFSESDEWWCNTCNGVDTVIHVAWYAEPGQYLQSPKNLDCLIGTLQLAKGAACAGVRRFVGIGTCFEYDLNEGTLTVNTPLRQSTPYAGCKAAAYLSLSQWLPQKKVEFAWCRIFYLYGEGEDSRRLVPYLRMQLAAGKPVELTSGNQIRDFLDVRVAAQMVVDTALSKTQGAVNICSGKPLTVRALAEQIADEYGRRDLLKFGVRPDNLVDPPCVLGVMD